MEIFTGVERRRRWSVADKLEIVAETEMPGATVASVAAKRDLCRSQIYQWRRQVRTGQLREEGSAIVDFLPVEICDAPEAPIHDDRPGGGARLTITLRCGRTLQMPSDLSCAEIRRLVAAVEAA